MSMAKIRLDNIEYQASEGMTIFEVASAAGIAIPTLCHNRDLPHYSSCMVCMVKDNKRNSFVPSCSMIVSDRMDIDVSGEDVVAMRRKAIEMLFAEHRAECEAPCHVVCPAGYNIPLMNRMLSANDYEGAYDLVLSEISPKGIRCSNCQGYCENACRRKKIDDPVSIKNIRLFIFRELISNNKISLNSSEENLSSERKNRKVFSSRTGKIEASELREWLKECTGSGIRYREIETGENASEEAGNCMHCDCRAAGDCRLRELGRSLGIKDPASKIVNAPVQKKINSSTGLIFENAKCIKCGLCVRICEDSNEEPALCFISRGFVSIISEPITENFNDILKNKASKVVDVCPTGALGFIDK
jgi:predicted molibdopterin-dependent oxidoreductase YjgC